MYRHTAFHVGGPAPVQYPVAVLFDHAGRHRTERPRHGRQRHGVQMPGEQDAGALLPVLRPEVGAGNNGVPVTHQVQVRVGFQGPVDGVGEGFLFPRDRVNIKQNPGQFGHGDVRVDGCGGVAHGSLSCSVSRISGAVLYPNIQPYLRPGSHLQPLLDAGCGAGP